MKKIEDLDTITRHALQAINDDLEAAQHGIEIKGLWETGYIHSLAEEDECYLRDEVIRLLTAGKMILLEDD